MRVGLGVDGSASNDASNLMQEVRAAFLLQRARYGVTKVSHRDALRWATSGSAACIGRPTLGEIKERKEADLAFFKLDELRFSGARRSARRAGVVRRSQGRPDDGRRAVGRRGRPDSGARSRRPDPAAQRGRAAAAKFCGLIGAPVTGAPILVTALLARNLVVHALDVEVHAEDLAVVEMSRRPCIRPPCRPAPTTGHLNGCSVPAVIAASVSSPSSSRRPACWCRAPSSTIFGFEPAPDVVRLPLAVERGLHALDVIRRPVVDDAR